MGLYDQPSCRVVLYRERLRLGSNSVLFIDNRPDREHSYHAAISYFFEKLKTEAFLGDVHEEIQHVGPERRRELMDLIEEHLEAGRFRDTSKIAEWLGLINQAVDFSRVGAKPLELVVAHAESHIALIMSGLEKGVRPAGIVLSGSPKMLSRVRQYPVIRQSEELVKYALEEEIPLLGICFGMHMLTQVQFGVQVKFLTVPKNMHVECIVRDGKTQFVPCRPDNRRMVFGTARIKRTPAGEDHPVLNAVKRQLGLEVHSQYVDPEWLPEDNVLAISERIFRQSQNSPKTEQKVQQMAEVISAGSVAIGTQLHPELQPWLLYVLSHFRAIENDLLKEKLDVEKIRYGLANYRDSHYAGQRVGYNWITRVMFPDYVDQVTDEPEARVALRGWLKYRGQPSAAQ